MGPQKKCPSGFAQPIGRTPGEQDLPWDAVSTTQIQRTGVENPDFGSVFVRGCAEPVKATSTPRHRHPGDLEPADSGSNECAVSTREHAARGLASTAAQQMAVRSRDQLDQRRSGPGLRQQAAENRPEMITDLHATTRAHARHHTSQPQNRRSFLPPPHCSPWKFHRIHRPADCPSPRRIRKCHLTRRAVPPRPRTADTVVFCVCPE